MRNIDDHQPTTESSGYWNQYYGHSRPILSPSQFAVFVHEEHSSTAPVFIDFGCGSGRDAFYFALQGSPTLAIDQSSVAVELCESRRQEMGLNHIQFVCGSVADLGILETIKSRMNGRPVAIYARFFIHAITDQEEECFLRLASELAKLAGGTLAVEFRTTRDRQQTKVTPAHFRRFVEPFHFVHRVEKWGFALSYFIEGFGFAKYKQDDAHVARCLFEIAQD